MHEYAAICEQQHCADRNRRRIGSFCPECRARWNLLRGSICGLSRTSSSSSWMGSINSQSLASRKNRAMDRSSADQNEWEHGTQFHGCTLGIEFLFSTL